MFPENKALKPRVSPHPGHGKPVMLLKTQLTSKTNTTSIPNTSSIELINIINFLLVN